MPSQPDGDSSSDWGEEGAEQRLCRRPLLRVGAATALGVSLAGCLNQSVEAEAVPLGISPAAASEAGYESEPQTGAYSVEQEQNVGPATIKAEVISTIVEYVYTGSETENGTEGANDLDYGRAGQVYGDEGGGVLTLMSTPELERFGQDFNQFTDRDVSELVRDFTPLFEKVCDCTVDGNRPTVERVSNPAKTTARPSENTVYVAPGDGGSDWNPQANASFLDEEIAEEDLRTLFVPAVENGTVTAYYVVGTREFVAHEDADGTRQFGIAAYTGRRESSALSPDGAVSLLGPEGLFGTDTIREFNERFAVVLREPVTASGQRV